MKNRIKLFGLIALVAVMGLGIIGCKDPNGDPKHSHDFSGNWKTTPTHHWHECPDDGVKAGDYAEHTFVNGVCNKCQYDNGTRTTQYTAQAEDGSAITLIITSDGTTIVIGDGYVLTITKDGETILTSTGTVSGINEDDGEITLQPSDTEADPFTVTVEEENITDIEGEITSDDGETVNGSEITIVPPAPDPECECTSPDECICDEDDCDCETCEAGDPDCEHKETAWHNHAPATCTAEGTDQLRCNNCHAVLDTRTTNMIAHTLAKTNAKDATCEAEGNPDYWTCSVCHKHFEDGDGKTELTNIVINATDHDYEWKETTAPTFTANGEETEICQNDTSHTRGKRPIPQLALDSIDAIADFLNNADGGETTDHPIPLKLAIDLGDMPQIDTGWWELLGILDTAGKYVELDLSDCQMDGTYFAPYATSSGKDKIIAITLPTAGTTIQEGFFTSSGGEWATFDYFTNLESVTIPDSYTAIPDYAFGVGTFSNNTTRPAKLKSVSIGNGVESIGLRAFYGTSLESIDIPDSVTTIGDSAFMNCTGLTSVTIGSGVTSIGGIAFYNCTSLESITIPFVGNTLNGTTNTHFGCIFGAITYSDNSTYVPASLKTVIITGGNSIGDNAFYQCTGLTSVTIPDSVTTIGASAFSGCTSLTSVTIPDSVTTIGQSAFLSCTSLTSVTVDPNNPNYVSQNNIVYSKDMKTLVFAAGGISGSVTIPDSVTTIGNSAFVSCTSLTSVTIPNSVTSIGLVAFGNCTSLASVTFERADNSFNILEFPNGASLRSLYMSSGIGTYTRDNSTVPIPNTVEWVKQD